MKTFNFVNFVKLNNSEVILIKFLLLLISISCNKGAFIGERISIPNIKNFLF